MVVVRHNLLVEAVSIEVFDVHRDGFRLGCVKPRVQPEIADDEIHSSVTVEIAGHEAIPPTVAFLEAPHIHALEFPASLVSINDYRHPIANDYQVGTPISGDIYPRRVGDHSNLRQTGRRLRRHISEMALSIVSQKHARRIEAVASGNYPSSDE